MLLPRKKYAGINERKAENTRVPRKVGKWFGFLTQKSSSPPSRITLTCNSSNQKSTLINITRGLISIYLWSFADLQDYFVDRQLIYRYRLRNRASVKQTGDDERKGIDEVTCFSVLNRSYTLGQEIIPIFCLKSGPDPLVH